MISDYEGFKARLNYSIQNSNLDVGAIYYILKDTINEVEKLYYAQLNKEALEHSKADNTEQTEE